MAFFLFYILLFGLYQSTQTTFHLLYAWAWSQVR
jgi:hypothetical protein